MADPLVALVGGDEFRPPAAEVDNTSSSASAAARARRHPADGGGARERPACGRERCPSLPRPRRPSGGGDGGRQVFGERRATRRAARRRRLVFIAGGDARHLLDTLRDSLVWQRLAGAVAEGCALAGSSAGAMVLGETMHFRGERHRGTGLAAGHLRAAPLRALGRGRAAEPVGVPFGLRFDVARHRRRNGLRRLGRGMGGRGAGRGDRHPARGASEVFRSGQRIELDQTS